LKKKINYFHSFDKLTHSVWVVVVLVRNDLEALADVEETAMSKRNWTMCISLKKTRRNY
jgi:hypothetical protein